jgi:hypothetical protein
VGVVGVDVEARVSVSVLMNELGIHMVMVRTQL